MRVELQPVDSLLLGPAHPRARLLGRHDLAASPPLPGADPLVVPHARRGDLVRVRALRLVQRPFESAERNAAHRRDPVRHPELVAVLRFRRLGHAARVHVHVDEPRQHVHPAGVDLSRRPLGTPGGIDRLVGEADARDLRRSGSSRPRCPPDHVAAPPVPSMSVAPRMISRSNGPSPSARFGAGFASTSCARRGARAMSETKAVAITRARRAESVLPYIWILRGATDWGADLSTAQSAGAPATRVRRLSSSRCPPPGRTG